MKQREVSLSKTCFVLTLLVIALYVIISFTSNLGTTYSYLTDGGKIMGVIKVEAIDLRVMQDLNLTDGASVYSDVEETYGGIILGTNSLATDKTYNYDVILRNYDTNETHYLRWKIEAKVDDSVVNMSEYCSTDATNVLYKNGYFYLVDNSNKSTTLPIDDTGTANNENQVKLLSSICVTGTYDADEHKVSESFLDDPTFSGRDIEFNIVIEGSATAYTIS